MRRLVLAAVMAVLIAGCGNAAQTAKNPEPPDSSPPVNVRHAKVGGAVLLTAAGAGGAGSLRLGVKVQQVVPATTGQGEFDVPRKGERFMAVRFVLKNLGTTPYDDSPTYGAKVVDGSGHEYDPTVATVSAGPGFGRLLVLRHDQVASGYIVFAVPRASRITGVRYTLNAGDRGEWDVPDTVTRTQGLHAKRARHDRGDR